MSITYPTDNISFLVKENLKGLHELIKDINISKGAANGIATLDKDGFVSKAQLPPFALPSLSVANITKRNAIVNTKRYENLVVYVLDASADTTVSSGFARYRLVGGITNTHWVKTTEQESLDVSLTPYFNKTLDKTDDITEGTTNLFFTDGRAKLAAIVNSTTGSETDKAASVKAMKNYIKSVVINNLTSTDKDVPVSALQAKNLQDNKVENKDGLFIRQNTTTKGGKFRVESPLTWASDGGIAIDTFINGTTDKQLRIQGNFDNNVEETLTAKYDYSNGNLLSVDIKNPKRLGTAPLVSNDIADKAYVDSKTGSGGVPIGGVIFSHSISHSGFIRCVDNNTWVSKTTYANLFAIIGDIYSTPAERALTANAGKFKLQPAKTALTGFGTGGKITTLGQTFGEEERTLTGSHMASHSHSVQLGKQLFPSSSGPFEPADFYHATYISYDKNRRADISTGSYGSGQPFSIMPPQTGLYKHIKT